MKFEIHCVDKTYECTPFTLDEYQGLITAKLNATLASEIKSLLASHVGPCLDLPKHQVEGIILKFWVNSLGDVNQEKEYICACGKTHSVNLNYNYINIPKETSFIYSLGDIKIKLRYPKLFEETDHINMLISCITHIITDTQEIPLGELTTQEINDLHNLITIDVYNELIKELLRPTISMGIPLDCDCPAYIIKGLPEFLSLVG